MQSAERKGVVRFRSVKLFNHNPLFAPHKTAPTQRQQRQRGEQKIFCIKRSENLTILMPKQFSMLQCRVVHKLLECFLAKERRLVEPLESDFDGSPFRMLYAEAMLASVRIGLD